MFSLSFHTIGYSPSTFHLRRCLAKIPFGIYSNTSTFFIFSEIITKRRNEIAMSNLRKGYNLRLKMPNLVLDGYFPFLSHHSLRCHSHTITLTSLDNIWTFFSYHIFSTKVVGSIHMLSTCYEFYKSHPTSSCNHIANSMYVLEIFVPNQWTYKQDQTQAFIIFILSNKEI